MLFNVGLNHACHHCEHGISKMSGLWLLICLEPKRWFFQKHVWPRFSLDVEGTDLPLLFRTPDDGVTTCSPSQTVGRCGGSCNRVTRYHTTPNTSQSARHSNCTVTSSGGGGGDDGWSATVDAVMPPPRTRELEAQAESLQARYCAGSTY